MVVPDIFSPLDRTDRFQYRTFLKDVDFETTQVFADVLGKTPYHFQARVRIALAAMSHPQHYLKKSSVLLVQPTGGGKSSVNVSHTLIQAGFSITIVPLLSLGVDQQSKLQAYPSNEFDGIINAIHLDDYRTASSQKLLCEQLLAI